jgi:hypothetical protein
VPAVLEREAPLGRKRACPLEQTLLAAFARRHGQLVDELARASCDGDGGVSLLVWNNPDYDHS